MEGMQSRYSYKHIDNSIEPFISNLVIEEE